MTQKLDETKFLELLELAKIAEQKMRQSSERLTLISRKMAQKDRK